MGLGASARPLPGLKPDRPARPRVQEYRELAEVIGIVMIVLGFLSWTIALVWVFRDLTNEPYG